MKFGLTNSEFQFILNNVVSPLKKLGATVWCYGSRARLEHQPFSDLDLMVEAKKTKELEALLSDIQEKLSQSNFPYKVDLVFLSDFAKSYQTEYEKDKKLFSDSK